MSFGKSLRNAAIFLILGLAAAGILSTRWPAGGIEISEVRSDWENIFRDSRGNYQGFIELYNSSNCPVDISGWSLSNSQSDLQKYTIPSGIIEPGEYQVFWSNSRADFYQAQRDADHYLEFSIADGDRIFLTNPHGKVADKVKISCLKKGDSYGRDPNTGEWTVCTASPAESNANTGKADYVDVKAPAVSVPSGFYDSGIDIQIEAAPGCEIYYTLDGSVPTESSPKYTGPIHLDDPTARENGISARRDTALIHHQYIAPEDRTSCHFVQRVDANPDDITEGAYSPSYPVPKIQVLRCIAVDEDKNYSPETYGSYLIDMKGRYGFQNVHILSMIVNPDDLFSDENGIYVCGGLWKQAHEKGIDASDPFWTAKNPTNYSVSGKDCRRPAQLELFGPDHHMISSQMAGITIHGGFSTAFNQKGFNVAAFPEEDGNEVLFPGVLEHDYKTVMLRPGGFRDTYYTKLRDALNQELVSHRDITTLKAIPCQVFINGEYWGLYNLQERIHQDTVAKKYDLNEKGLIVLKTNRTVAGKADDCELYNQMVQFAVNNDLSLSANYKKISEMMDIQSYIDYMCMETYVGNCDSIANNVAMWRTRHAVDDGFGDGRWRWIIYDTDDSSGVEERGITDVDVDSFNAGHWVTAPTTDALFMALCQNEAFKMQFADTFIDMAETDFEPGHVTQVLSEMSQLYCAPTVVSQHRFLSEKFSEEDYTSQIEVINNYFQNRNSYIYNYMVDALELIQYGYKKQPVQ